MQYAAENSTAVDLTAVCDLDQDRARRYAEDFGFARVYGEAVAMLDAEAPDAVLAITPPAVTPTLASDLLERGVPVLIEKPPGVTADAAADLLATARRTETPHAVSLNRRFDPAVRRAREWLATAAENPPEAATVRVERVGRTEAEFLVATGIHPVDTTLSLLGAPTRVSSRRWDSPGGGQSAQVRVDFAEGNAAQLLLAPDAGSHVERYTLVGPGYTVRIDVGASAVSATRDGEQVRSWTAPDDAPAHVRDGTMAETRAFLSAVASNSDVHPTLAEATLSLRVAEAVDAGGDHEISAIDS